MNEKRLVYIDVLKVIALLLIVLAHVSPPGLLFQLRNFDVVLMILISSYLGLKNFKSENNWFKQVIKRFKRLVIPTWIFLSIFFLLNCFLGLVNVNWKTILGSYALSNVSIGYVWVIRIYFIISLLVILNSKIEGIFNKNILLINSIILFVTYEILCWFGFFNNIFLEYLIAYIIPCQLLLSLSKYVFDGNKKTNIIILVISIIVFLSFGYVLFRINGSVQQTQIMKYPFRSYYLSYGLICSIILIYLTRHISFKNNLCLKFVMFVSKHSLWFYFWHIIAIYVLKSTSIIWCVKYIIVVLFALIVTFIQSVIVNKINNKNSFINYFCG